MYEHLGSERQLWCFRGYPFKCPVIEPLLTDVDDLFADVDNLLLALDEFCRNCRERLEYERSHVNFTV